MLNMIFALSILLLSSTVFSYNVPSEIHEDWVEVVNRIKMECLEQGNTTLEAVNAIYETWDIDESHNCFLKCVYEKDQYIDTEGHFTKALLQRKGLTKENVKDCEHAVEAYNKETCDRVYYFNKCIIPRAIDDFIHSTKDAA
ncbi:hypothetical protein PPYR_06395 [Photinus pyralis]|uniref:Uncharacterized protein n=1 Tax=Photinus pyralis TaxID=7054 RepID=A0A1Y1MP12_PHOPY|nr:uncharacterized protein LOC116166602 [Photinus pyralis]KAB0800656.1 hypothetical protein PPYR_06395 [Photinus pyralis]